MNFNTVAQLIDRVNRAYATYNDTCRTINMHYHLSHSTNKDIIASIEQLDFTSFDEDELRKQSKHYHDLSDSLIKKHRRLYYDVDTDDYK